MGTTPTYALPYPELTDQANVPVDMRELAEAVDTTVSTRTPKQWCDLYANAVQAMGNATEVPMNLNGGVQEPAGQWTSGANVKILTAGLYLVTFTYSFAPHATNNGSRIALLKHNGATARSWSVANTATTATTGTLSHVRRFAVNDTVALYQYQSTGASLNTHTQAYPGVSLAWLGT